jgi:hypothetical protein
LLPLSQFYSSGITAYRVLAAVNNPELSKDELNQSAHTDGLGWNAMFQTTPLEAARDSLESVNSSDLATGWDSLQYGIHVNHKLEPVLVDAANGDDGNGDGDDAEAAAVLKRKANDRLVRASFPDSTLR